MRLFNQPNDGIQYQLTGRESRGQVQAYHRKPEPLNLAKKAGKTDVAGLKKVTERSVLKVGDGIEAKFTIGFEVEKNQLSRNAVKEYELFCGFERDASCGYEAVTHILPLLPACQWRTKVFDLMYKAEKIIDDRFSPSDRRCGGHITVAVDGLGGAALLEKIRGNAAIILAIFAQRLKNNYCSHNATMLGEYEVGYVNGWHSKYQVALVKGDCVEFRIPSRFQSVKQMMRRYELFYELLDYSVNHGGSFDTFLKRITPILLSMYSRDQVKVSQVLELAKKLNKFILNGTWCESLREYFPLHRR